MPTEKRFSPLEAFDMRNRTTHISRRLTSVTAKSDILDWGNVMMNRLSEYAKRLTINKISEILALQDATTIEKTIIDLKLINLSQFDSLCIAVNLKERGFTRQSHDILRQNIEIYGENSDVMYEFGLLLALEDCKAGVDMFLRSLKANPANYNACRILVFISAFLGDIDIRNNCQSIAGLDLLLRVDLENGAFLRYLAIVSRNQEQEASRKTGIFDNNLGKILPIDEILPAICAGSLIRLGDGEGAMCSFSKNEEIQLADIYSGNREYFAKRWRGRSFYGSDTDYVGILEKILDDISQFDVLGIPEPTWLIRSFANGDTQGFSSAFNLIRRLCDSKNEISCKLTSTSIFYDILHHGSLSKVLNTEEKVVAITWNPMIKLMLKLSGFLGEADHISISPAISDKLSFLPDSQFGQILPEAVSLDLPELSRGNKTVILCAGFFGKLLGTQLREAGHRVLDAGSSFDVSFGVPIR